MLNEGQVLPLKLAEKKESEKSSTASTTENNIEQTREADHVLSSQQCSLKNFGHNHVESKCQELDATVMVVTESVEIVKKNEVVVTEENQAKIGEADIDLVEDDDNPGQTKGNLNETKEEVEEVEDNLEIIEDNPGQTKGNQNETKKDIEEMKESDINPGQTRGNLDGSEDNLGRSKDNLKTSEDNLEQNKDDL